MIRSLALAAFVTAMPLSSAIAQSSLAIDFADPASSDGWRVVNDGVMGGRSQGWLEFKGNAMIFQGTINTNGGGFSSIRNPVKRGTLGNATGLRFRVRSDGRTYKATLRTNATYYGRQISFQAELPTDASNDWQEVTVTFDDLKPSLFGRPVRGAKFNPAQVRSMGIIIADGIDGDFRLEIAAISALTEDGIT